VAGDRRGPEPAANLDELGEQPAAVARGAARELAVARGAVHAAVQRASIRQWILEQVRTARRWRRRGAWVPTIGHHPLARSAPRSSHVSSRKPRVQFDVIQRR
jgi:hypothetical protein